MLTQSTSYLQLSPPMALPRGRTKISALSRFNGGSLTSAVPRRKAQWHVEDFLMGRSIVHDVPVVRWSVIKIAYRNWKSPAGPRVRKKAAAKQSRRGTGLG
jgi:hypothetical protein